MCIRDSCNAGWLAAVDWGTALAPIFKAKKNNIPIHVCGLMRLDLEIRVLT